MALEEKGARAFAACVYLPVGCFALVIGGHDFLVSPEVGSRSGGLLLLLAGFVLIAMAIALLAPSKKWSPRRKWVPRAGVYAGAIGILVGCGFAFAQAIGPDGGPEAIVLLGAVAVLSIPLARLGWQVLALTLLNAVVLVAGGVWLWLGDGDQLVVAWVAIAAFSGLAALALARTNPPKLGFSPSKVALGVAGFVSLSALVGVAQFWYTTQYLPGNERVSLSVESGLRRLGGYDHNDVVELKLTVQNISETPAQILGSVYRVSGANGWWVAHSDREMKERIGRPLLGGQAARRYYRGSAWDMVQVGRVFGFGWWLDPDEKFSRVTLVHVPHDRYETLRSQAEVLFAKGSSLTLDYDRVRVDWVKHSRWDARGVKLIWGIDETSWFRDLTRGERKLRIKWVTANDAEPRVSRFPQVHGAIARTDENPSADEFRDYQGGTEGLYGIAHTISTNEISLGLSR